MNDRLHDAFNKIQAEKSLKENTAAFIHNKIQREEKKIKSHMRIAFACASFALILLAGGFSYNLYFTEAAYIDIDVNPSVEITLNRFDRVIEAKAYNDDGTAILENVNVHHKKYNQAVEMIIDDMISQGFLKEDSLFSATVQSQDENKEKEALKSLRAAVEASFNSHHWAVETDIFAVSKEVKAHAHENHLSPAKYLAITQLQAIDSTATFEGCKDHSISEIRQRAAEHEQGQKHHEEQFDGHRRKEHH